MISKIVKNTKTVVLTVIFLFSAAAASAGTVAYWELDGSWWDLADSVGWYDVEPFGVVNDSNLKANPIPNPDPHQPWWGEDDDSRENPLASWFMQEQYFYVPNDADSDLHDRTFDFYPEKSFTIEGWMRPRNSGLIVGNQHSSAASHQFGGSFKGWRIASMGGGTTLLFEIDGTALSDQDVQINYDPTGSSDPDDFIYDNLHHFAGVYDAETLEMRLYIDGELVGTNTIPETWIGDSWTVHRGGALSMGGRDTGDGNFTSLRYSGGSDEIRYSNIALGPKDFLNANRTVAYWEFDGESWAADPVDSVGDNHLTALGEVADSALFVDPVPNPDRSLPWEGQGDDAAENGGACYFTPSTGDVFYIPNTNDPETHDYTFDFNAEKSFTVDGWFRANSSGTIIGNAHSATASHQLNGGYTGWRFYTTGGGSVLNFGADGSSNGDSVTISTDIQAGELYHFAGAYDADKREMRLYLDGEQVASSQVPETWQYSRGGSLAIGARDAGTGFDSLMFNGAIDELRYSAYAFEEKDFLNYVKPVIAYWELDGASWDGRDSVSDFDVTFVGELTDSSLRVDPIPNRETSSPWWGQTGDDEFYNPRAVWFNAGVAAYVPNTNDPEAHDSTFDLELGKSLTIEGWFRPTNSGTIIGNQHSIESSHQVNGSYKGWRVHTSDGGVTLNFSADCQADAGGAVVISGPCQEDVLQHFAAVYDAKASEMRLYLDGVLIDSSEVPGTWSSHRGGAVAIGGRDNGDGTFTATDYVGAIDEVRLVTKALSPSEFLSPSEGAVELVCGDYGYLAADFNRDCYVDVSDFADMAANWLYE
jgi:hypothetical protein